MENKLEQLKEATYKLFDLQEKQKELMYKLIEALTVKDYKEKNPDAKSVVLISYYAKNVETKSIDRYKTFECIDSTDHKRINRLQNYFGRAQYRELVFKSYDLTKFESGKTIATYQKDISKALN